MASPPTFDRKMTDTEALMWRLDKEGAVASTFGNVTVLDKRPDVDRLRRRLDRATIAVPRLRQHVVASASNITPPLWVDDPEFELDYHVRHISLPRPGTMRQLLDLATLIVADPFERTRPLWQFVLVDGLRGGKSAMVQKLHHTVTDGEGGIKLSMQFLDVERDAPEPPPLTRSVAGDDATGPGDSAKDILAGSLKVPFGVFRQIRDLLMDPTQIPSASFAAAETMRGIIAQLSDAERAHSPLWTARSPRRRFDVFSVPLEDLKVAAKRLGGTLNTAFLTAAADAAGQYHRALSAPVDTLRATMAVSTRTSASGSNAFTLARLLVPTGDMPVAARFEAIKDQADAAREASTTANLEALAGVAATLPASLIARIARQQAQTIDFATSNVRAAPFPVYMAGAQVLANYPMGPLGGVAFNLTTMSYSGSMDMGLNVDAAAVAEPERLRKAMEAAFKRLVRV
jgi:WS/DGAT/MGAT family acyltransferase